MRISEDVRQYAAEHGFMDEALEQGCVKSRKNLRISKVSSTASNVGCAPALAGRESRLG